MEGFGRALVQEQCVKLVNQLKFRASYGELGDDGDVNYEWATGYTYPAGELSTSGYYGAMLRYIISALG